MREKHGKLMALALCIGTCMVGCNMQRGVTIHNELNGGNNTEDINPVNISVEYGEEFDVEAITDYFYDSTVEDLVANSGATDTETEFLCEKDGIELTYSKGQNYLSLNDWREYAGSSYGHLLRQQFFFNEMSQRLMEWFPEGELENYSSQKVVKACEQFAKACGYGEAQVTIYAMELEGLWEAAKFMSLDGDFNTAPNPDYEYISGNEISSAMEKGDTELALKLMKQKYSEPQNAIEWEKKHEAYLLVYRTRVNGMLMDSKQHGMWCIYVPEYERVVIAEVGCPLITTNIEQETELITKEEALAKALPVIQVESEEDITVTNISLVYSPRTEQLFVEETEEKVLNPCWRIDYVIKEEKITTDQYQNDDGTVLINAVDGFEVEY